MIYLRILSIVSNPSIGHAETALGVSAAPPAAELVEASAHPDYTPMLAGIIVAIVAVAILSVYAIVSIRKRQ